MHRAREMIEHAFVLAALLRDVGVPERLLAKGKAMERILRG